MKKKIEFNGQYLNFDRVYKCDWCGNRTEVAITQYGTTHYNRLICEKCAKKIIDIDYDNLSQYEKREAIHKIQKYCDSDIASLKLMSPSNNNVFLSTGSDGSIKYAVVGNEKIIPSYYKRLEIILSGKWKIMAHDCAKDYNESGEEIEANYIEFYQSGMSFIIRVVKEA